MRLEKTARPPSLMLSASMYSETRREQSSDQQNRIREYISTHAGGERDIPIISWWRESNPRSERLQGVPQPYTSVYLSEAAGIEAGYSSHLSSGAGAHLSAPFLLYRNYNTD